MHRAEQRTEANDSSYQRAPTKIETKLNAPANVQSIIAVVLASVMPLAASRADTVIAATRPQVRSLVAASDHVVPDEALETIDFICHVPCNLAAATTVKGSRVEKARASHWQGERWARNREPGSYARRVRDHRKAFAASEMQRALHAVRRKSESEAVVIRVLPQC